MGSINPLKSGAPLGPAFSNNRYVFQRVITLEAYLYISRSTWLKHTRTPTQIKHTRIPTQPKTHLHTYEAKTH